MQRRQEEARNQLLLDELNRLFTNSKIPVQFSERFKERFLKGADELELVRSGLEDTMRLGYQSMRELWRSRDDCAGSSHRRIHGFHRSRRSGSTDRKEFRRSS